MLRLLFKTPSTWRSISLAAIRLNEADQKLSMLDVAPNAPQSVNDVISGPLVVAKPFAELHYPVESSNNVDSEVAEFIDDLSPPLPISFNLASYVNFSESLQNLVRLGVNLSEIEKVPEKAKYILHLDFEKNVKRHIQFMHDNGIHADDLGKIITKNPFLFQQDIKNLEIKINYLKSKKFNSLAIARIITKNPYFLSLDTKHVDTRLGFFQQQFCLSGHEVRHLVTTCPKLVSYSFDKFREKLFIIKEELGYSRNEMKRLILMKPKIWMLGNKVLKERFGILHNLMGLSHERILDYPNVFLTRGFIVKQRHLYLVRLNRAQYDPTLPLYVSLEVLTTTSDSEFCEKCANTSLEQFNQFLKSI